MSNKSILLEAAQKHGRYALYPTALGMIQSAVKTLMTNKEKVEDVKDILSAFAEIKENDDIPYRVK